MVIELKSLSILISKSVSRHTDVRFTVIVVADGSSDRAVERAADAGAVVEAWG